MSEKILLVDDEEEFLEIMAERMKLRGFDVTTCSSAEKALDLIEKTSFDAIVLDLMMPDKDGIDTLKEMKNLKPELQIILLTGHASLEKGIDAMKFGAMDFLEKPADLNKLIDMVKKAKAERLLIAEEKMQKKIESILKEKGW